MARKKKGRRRRRSPKKRRRSYRRRGTRRGPRKTKGFAARIGGFMLGVVPVIIGGVAAFEDAGAHYKKVGGMGSTIKIGLYDFVNTMTLGFLGSKAFKEASYISKDGSHGTRSMPDTVPKGSLWLVAGTGLLLIAYDFIASKLAGGEMKIPFTNYTAVGSR